MNQSSVHADTDILVVLETGWLTAETQISLIGTLLCAIDAQEAVLFLQIDDSWADFQAFLSGCGV